MTQPSKTSPGTLQPAPASSPIGRRGVLKRLTAVGAVVVASGCTPVSDDAWAFTHGVASGDPTQSALVIWTRVAARGGSHSNTPATGTWEVAEDESFAKILSSGAFATGPERDYTVKIDVTDLPAGRGLTYRFKIGNILSPVGRATTLPDGDPARLRLALFSCSNYAFGYFNAYRHCAEREDIDIAIHVGDYLYEYGAGKYGDPSMEASDRKLVPDHEILTLADYRARHALYRSDPDLQEVHRRLSFVTVWDDHEITNDAWLEGAENHQENEGLWSARREAALRAYFEWMPIRPMNPDQSARTYRSFSYGNLASIIMLDTRIYGRDRPLRYESDVPMIEPARKSAEPNPLPVGGSGSDTPARQQDWDKFRTMLNDPQRTILGFEQEAWLNEEFKRSQAQGKKWRIIGQQTLLGLMSPPDLRPLMRDADITDAQRQAADLFTEVSKENLPIFLDSFGGSYQAARTRLLQNSIATGGNTVILTGDSHNAWAFNLADAHGTVAAVEISATSVTSPGLEDDLPIDSDASEKALVGKNPELV